MQLGGVFKGRDRLDLSEFRWVPDGEVIAHVVLIHGYAEHCGRYQDFARALNRHDIALYAYDLRGHGQSGGRRGHIDDFSLLVSDHKHYLRHMGGIFKHKPLFFLGHSLGGLILARHATENDPAATGLIFSSPLLQLPPDTSPLLLRFAKLISTLAPGLPVGRVEAPALSRDKAVLHDYENDPLVYQGRINARTGAQIHAAIETVLPRLPEITLPIYVLHGDHDWIVPVSASTMLHDVVQSEDRILRIYEGAYHELLNDLDKQQVTTELCTWLFRQVDAWHETAH